MSKVSIKKLSRSPQKIDEYNWYYEETKGIWLVHGVYDKNNKYIKTDEILIPWKVLQTTHKRIFLDITPK